MGPNLKTRDNKLWIAEPCVVPNWAGLRIGPTRLTHESLMMGTHHHNVFPVGYYQQYYIYWQNLVHMKTNKNNWNWGQTKNRNFKNVISLYCHKLIFFFKLLCRVNTALFDDPGMQIGNKPLLYWVIYK